jgi:hypothetical protein
MPLVIADRVRETTTTSGTGSITLAGPYLGFQAFSVIGNGNTTYYVIIDAQNGAWEVGIGTYTSAGNTLARTTVLVSSNAGSLVNFAVGTKDVILTQPAGRSVLVQEGGSGLLAGTTAFTANGVPYANSSSTLTTGPSLVFDGTNLGIGTSTPTTLLNLYSATAATALISGDGVTSFIAARSSNDTTAANLNFRKYRGTTAVPLIINTGDSLGNSNYTGYDGSALLTAATITGVAESVSGAGDIAGALTLSTRPAGSGASNTERMRIDSAGNVGIGTSSPTLKLNIASSLNNDGLRIENTNSANTAAKSTRITFYGTDTVGAVKEAADIYVVPSDNNYVGSNMLFFNRGADVVSERMRIDSAGNVGIGTSSPLVPLHVKRAAGGKTDLLIVENDVDPGIQILDSGNWSSRIFVQGSTGSLVFENQTNTERMRIDNLGNLQVQTGAVVQWAPAPASISTTATLTNADIQGQIINTTGTSYTVTMPLGTTLETLVTWAATNLGYDFSVINTASGTITVAINTGITSLGGLTIATGVSAQFRIRRTAANTFVLYRLS